MDKTSLILSSILGIAFVLLLAPNIVAMNRGKILRNIALWLAIFAGLGLAYQTVGPGRLDSFSAASGPSPETSSTDAAAKNDQKNDTKDNDQGYFPPKED